MAFHVLETFQSFLDGFRVSCIRQADMAFSILAKGRFWDKGHSLSSAKSRKGKEIFTVACWNLGKI